MNSAVGVTGSFEIGIAEDLSTLTERNKFVSFWSVCAGIVSDIAVEVDVNLGLWKSLDKVPGLSKGFSIGGDPGTGLGITLQAVVGGNFWNVNKLYLANNVDGVVVSVGVAAGLSPLDLAFVGCKTVPFHYQNSGNI